MKQTIYYEKRDKKCPFETWLNDLDKALRQKIQVKITKLENENYSDCSILKKADGVREARIRIASGIRIYFAEDGKDIIILLAGGDKDTQDNDIKNAIEYWNDYKQRKSEYGK